MESAPSTSSCPVVSTSSPSCSSSPPRKEIMRLPNGVTAADVAECLKQLVLSSRRVPLLYPPRIPEQHECNPTCDFFVHGIMFVCRRSNNIHFCSLSACNRLTTDGEEDSQVCEVTACCYPLNYVMSAEMEMNSGMHSQIPKAHAPDKTVCKRNRDQANPTVAEKQRVDTHNTIKAILGPIRTKTGVPLLEAVNTTLLAETANQLWRACVGTAQYKEQPYRYRHRYHVLVVLYNAIKGLKTDNGSQILIQQNELIRRYLPPFRSLSKLTKIKDLDVSTFTKTNKIFLACMRELHHT